MVVMLFINLLFIQTSNFSSPIHLRDLEKERKYFLYKLIDCKECLPHLTTVLLKSTDVKSRNSEDACLEVSLPFFSLSWLKIQNTLHRMTHSFLNQIYLCKLILADSPPSLKKKLRVKYDEKVCCKL